jgi:molybdopterin converting factor subunit 1
MKYTIYYFGMTAEASGAFQEQMECTTATTTRELREHLAERHEKLKKIEFQLAVNRSIADDEASLVPGDEIALLPPFAGG